MPTRRTLGPCAAAQQASGGLTRRLLPDAPGALQRLPIDGDADVVAAKQPCEQLAQRHRVVEQAATGVR